MTTDATNASIRPLGRSRRLTRQVNRILKPIAAGLAWPIMPDAIARQMLRPFRGNDIRSALRTLIDSHSSHRRFLHLCFLKLSARQGNAVTSGAKNGPATSPSCRSYCERLDSGVPRLPQWLTLVIAGHF